MGPWAPLGPWAPFLGALGPRVPWAPFLGPWAPFLGPWAPVFPGPPSWGPGPPSWGSNVGKSTKIIKNEPNQVEIAPFGLKLAQDRSHGLWGASGMPPGPQNHQKCQKNQVFGV